MELIVDANILFAALIKQSGTAALLCRSDITLYTPEYIFEEFKKYEGDILAKTKRNPEDFKQFLRILESKITLLAKEEVEKFIPKAIESCPDPKDIPYFACALAKKCTLWSNDKKLKEQYAVSVINTTELFQQLL